MSQILRYMATIMGKSKLYWFVIILPRRLRECVITYRETQLITVFMYVLYTNVLLFYTAAHHYQTPRIFKLGRFVCTWC